MIRIKKILNSIMYSSNIGYLIVRIILESRNFWVHRYYLSDISAVKKRFKITQGYKLNIKKPKTFNEKIQWLKLNDRRTVHTLYADKLAVRNILENRFGKEGLIDLIFQTKNWKDIKIENLPDFPFIIKSNHGSGFYHIVEDKNKVDWNKIRTDCRLWLSSNYYLVDREWQYKNTPRCLIVEKLLIPKNGGIPNNYRIHCLDGKVEIISVNYYIGTTKAYIAKKYNRKWESLDFRFGTEEISKEINMDTINVPKPITFDRMMFIAESFGQEFAYVRVDFYEVDGILYYGEITFHDSGGYDRIIPFEWDIKLGEKIKLK